MNWYKHHLGDYIKKTRHLSLIEHGAYRQLLDMQYLTEKPLPTDIELIFRSTGVKTALEEAVIRRMIKQFFHKTRWGYINERAMEEIRHADSVRKERTAAAAKRWGGNGPANANAYANASAKQHAKRMHSQTPDSRHQNEESLRFSSSQDTKIKQVQGEKKEATAPARPECIPVALWLAFVEMRKKERHPLTVYAGELIRKKLADFQSRGFDPVAILETSIANGWRGVFEPKEKANGPTRKLTGSELTRANLKAAGFRTDG